MIIGEGISEDGSGALRLSRIHRDQEGNYSVSAHTSRGTAHSNFFINVQCKFVFLWYDFVFVSYCFGLPYCERLLD